MAHKIESAYDAFWFLTNHPKQVEEHPDHPFLPSRNDEGIKSFQRMLKRPLSDEYRAALNQGRVLSLWEGQFINNLWIHYTKVNPETNRVEDDKSLNTKDQVWLESGPAQWDDYSEQYIGNVHDIRLDCGGDTFDQALINLAHRVLEIYGDYEDNE